MSEAASPIFSMAPGDVEHAPHRLGVLRRTRRQRISPGQIDDRNRMAVLRISGADLFFHGHARIVSDLLFQAGQRVEKRALAAVRIADEGIDGLTRAPGSGCR